VDDLDVFSDFFEVVWPGWMLVLIGYCQSTCQGVCRHGRFRCNKTGRTSST